MIILVQARVLLVGLNGKSEVLRELPIKLMKTGCGREAARYLKNEQVDAVVCDWNLIDMPNGIFIKRLRSVKPNIKTIVIIKSGDISQEIAARSTGPCAVLTEQSGDEPLRETIAETLKLTSTFSYKERM